MRLWFSVFLVICGGTTTPCLSQTGAEWAVIDRGEDTPGFQTALEIQQIKCLQFLTVFTTELGRRLDKLDDEKAAQRGAELMPQLLWSIDHLFFLVAEKDQTKRLAGLARGELASYALVIWRDRFATTPAAQVNQALRNCLDTTDLGFALVIEPLTPDEQDRLERAILARRDSLAGLVKAQMTATLRALSAFDDAEAAQTARKALAEAGIFIP